MKIASVCASLVIACSASALCACAGVTQSDAGQQAPPLRMYTFGEIAQTGYEVVARLPAESWRTAFRLPTFPSQDQAISALNTEATRLGANGLLNVSCLDQGRDKRSLFSSTDPAFLCYGIAIRVRTGQG